MDRKQKLELNWIGKYDEIKVEPRILLEDKSWTIVKQMDTLL